MHFLGQVQGNFIDALYRKNGYFRIASILLHYEQEIKFH